MEGDLAEVAFQGRRRGWDLLVAPAATPWLPTTECLAALSGIGEAFKERLGDPETVTMARFSSKVGVDVAKVSDDDIIAMRRSEELFATWRRFVAELSLEVDRLAIDNSSDISTLVQAKEVLWRAELDRQIGRCSVVSAASRSPAACLLV